VATSCLLESKGGNMLEDHVSAKITRKRLNSGPAANHINDFSDWLYTRGYKIRGLFRMLQSFAAWTDWLTKTGRTAEDFAEGLQECTKHVMSDRHVPYERGSSLRTPSRTWPSKVCLNGARLSTVQNPQRLHESSYHPRKPRCFWGLWPGRRGSNPRPLP
jgi:hypothetical protein